MLLGTAFSAMHVVAWNWNFPTPVEQLLWRVASITPTVICPVIFMLFPVIGDHSKKWQRVVVWCAIYPLGAVYFLARATLVVQVVLCLRALPKAAYDEVDWTFYVPHIS